MPETPQTPEPARVPATLGPRAIRSARWWQALIVLGLLLTLALLVDPWGAAWADAVPPAWLSLARAVTGLGNSGYMLGGTALFAAAAMWRGHGAPTAALRAGMVRAADAALFVFAAVAASGVAAQFAKHGLGRARPRLDGLPGAGQLHPFSLGNGFASFPSGHSTSAFAAATALGLLMPRARPALFGVAVAVGLSRVVLREHYVSDVVGGAALGTLFALALARAPAASRLVRALLARGVDRATLALAHRGTRAVMRPLAMVGAACARHGAAPALAASLFTIAAPPTDLFGSTALEEMKDGFAVMLALAGLTIRALVVGLGPVPRSPGRPAALVTSGAYGACRHPVYAGNVLILLAVLLMHGNGWTVLLGTIATLLLSRLMVEAEEHRLLRLFGSAYAAYQRRVPRWLPAIDGLRRVGAVRPPFDLRRALGAEYPVIGLTVVALTAAEFFEELQEPWIADRLLDLALLAALMLTVVLALVATWVARRRLLADPR